MYPLLKVTQKNTTPKNHVGTPKFLLICTMKKKKKKSIAK